eukprot:CAMPEP_0115285818 /NCGR_PEP_ID=MMETSP0270-20121206/61626_1 /TAXON_ID=71861 /ORGANISM="Scrippsiella trochoidea, Strain CCMP3099" /LENGTH=103 /DNA_ID=CAMNT_0002702851 /DNA_START=67 /DNA_END=378 /DNA_ORIENTATION=+
MWRIVTAAVLLAGVVGRTAAQEDAKEAMEKLDKDKNGKLTYDEILKGVLEEDGEEPDKEFEAEFKTRLDKHFKASDKDGDESLDVDELTALMGAFEKEDEEEL